MLQGRLPTIRFISLSNYWVIIHCVISLRSNNELRECSGRVKRKRRKGNKRDRRKNLLKDKRNQGRHYTTPHPTPPLYYCIIPLEDSN